VGRRISAARAAGWRPLVGGFVIWFVHFMGCWAAAELWWPGRWPAHVLAWALTVLALAALGWEWRRLRASPASGGDFAGWNRRIGTGATAIAAAAVVFGAMPSLVLLP
jgi:membrane protein implicated in regulation of membrane protease activity